MKVSNLISIRSGEAVRNQFSIENNDIRYFQSYDSLIAKYEKDTLTLGYNWDYSNTTKKYLHQWLQEECCQEWSRICANIAGKSFGAIIQKAIENGYILYDENMN